MALDRVDLDCKKMLQYGQLAVGLSRARLKKGLQVLNFSKLLLKPPPTLITDYLQREPLPVEVDFFLLYGNQKFGVDKEGGFNACANPIVQEALKQAEEDKGKTFHNSPAHLGKIRNDKDLKSTWTNLFLEFKKEVSSDILDSVFEEILDRYTLMSIAQLRKEYLEKKHTRKLEATLNLEAVFELQESSTSAQQHLAETNPLSESVDHLEEQPEQVSEITNQPGAASDREEEGGQSKYASSDSVGCDRCDTWYHAVCLKIDDLENLGDPWHCQPCIADIENESDE
ncbi:unnamed protein product [Mytilus coruscus]|uniref:Zinc finger PHD-type domain-containing protein n=1 Tax=Mytilus coruscus TaxID=42192 RepID=A0A6J8CX41_MYTCO|nr:unnamed protein product [Mytilus coruscus]